MRVPFRLLGLAALSWTMALPGWTQDEAQGGQGGMMAQFFGRGNSIRGTVTALAEGRFTIRTEKGDTYQVLYGPNTRILKDRQPIQATGVHVGDMLVAGGQLDAEAKTIGAVFLFDVDAAQANKAREGFGKTWTAGKVTAIQDLKITIERAGDKQTQIVAVDENTSFRKQREDVTLGDVKVGDMITAQGGLEGGAFLATTLRIVEPGSGPGNGFGRGGAPGGGAGSGAGATARAPSPPNP